MFSSKKVTSLVLAVSLPLSAFTVSTVTASDKQSENEQTSEVIQKNEDTNKTVNNNERKSDVDDNGTTSNKSSGSTSSSGDNSTSSSPKTIYNDVNVSQELEKIREMRKQIGNVDQKKTVMSNELSEILNSINETEASISVLHSQITDLENNIKLKESSIKELKEKISNLEIKIQNTQVKVNKQKEELGSSLSFMYENRNNGFFQLFFQSENLSEFFKSIDFMNLMIDSNQQLYEEVKALEESLSKQKVSLQSDLDKLNSTVASLQTDLTDIEKKKNDQVAILDKNKDVEEAKVAEIESQEKYIKELNSQIADSLSKIGTNNTASKDVPLTPKQKLITPIKAGSYSISSLYGYRTHPVYGYAKLHNGLDLAANYGTPVYAAGNGTVIEAGPASGFGNWIVIREDNGLYTVYGHMETGTLYVKRGQRVQQGQLITKVGSAGTSTGPHLHFSVATSYTNGKFTYIDPLKVF